MSISRRAAIQTLAVAGATAVLPRPLHARSPRTAPADAVAILYDSTRCVGCRECVRQCAETRGCEWDTNGGAEPKLSPVALSVVQRRETSGGPAFVKMQCMHCVDPACVSACMLGAMRQNGDGSVTWEADLCVGCRYCQIGCPFTLPRFEWDTPFPELTKCDLCVERRAEGELPACVDSCRMGALVYGPRTEVLAEAHQRIAERPERYNPHVYGESENGGTGMLYLAKAGVSFAEMGLPSLPEKSPAAYGESVHHMIYKWFMAPLALFGVFVTRVRRTYHASHNNGNGHNGKGHDGNGHGGGHDGGHGGHGGHGHGHDHPAPLGGKLLTWPFLFLALLTTLGMATFLYRFVVGLGPATALNDGYPKGLWLTFNVVVGTAMACGGYALAITVYLFNKGKYHPLVRSAMLVSALGYTLGGTTVLIDLGRTWHVWKLMVYPGLWNFNSVLLEVALCVILYTCVLWIEISPSIMERWEREGKDRLRRIALFFSPKLNRVMPYAIAVGLLLPTMHQSSLGSLMLLAGQKLHPLWQTPLLPLLFLVSCVGMGFASTTLESLTSSWAFKRPRETPMLQSLARPASLVLLFYVALRLADVTARGHFGLILAGDLYSSLFLIEMGLFVIPAVGLLVEGQRASMSLLIISGITVMLAGGLYRFSSFLIAFNPGPEWTYWPTPMEYMGSIGLVSLGIMGYTVIVKKLPILRSVPSPEAALPPEPAVPTEKVRATVTQPYPAT
jgi:Ni/Fe-hydrogenase subunit HybB-like protein/Fe-S-cluster-containing dehydrogenase component